MTATEKWEDPWFRNLPIHLKLFWIFLLDKCTHAGIWDADLKLAEFYLGNSIDESEVLAALDSRIVILPDGKWFIPKFINFQYGALSPDNRAHTRSIGILRKYGISENGDIRGIEAAYMPTKQRQRQRQQQRQEQKQRQKQRSR